MKHLVLFLFLNLFHLGISQNNTSSFSLKAVVVDSSNFERMPFASIHKLRDKKGTLTDFNGEFTLEKVLPNDSIIIKYTGYEKILLIAFRSSSLDTIYLNRKVLQIDEVIVLADNSILYDMISNSRQTQRNNSEVAKSYFELQSYHNDQQLELFQAYYNGTYQGYNVSDLQMKNGRFTLAPISKRIFASTESSKALYMHNIMESNDYFPSSPFEFNKRKLRKNYILYLNAKYKDDKDKTVYVISFEPRRNPNSYFEGKIWIDSLSNNILKTKLYVSNASNHPFRSIWSKHSLDTVNIEITKSYFEDENTMKVNTIDFKYDLIYKSEDDSSLNISTQAFLHAFDYNSEFMLPYFNFPVTSNADYRRIQMLPENSQFWSCIDEFKIKNNEAKNAFIQDHATIKSYDLFKSDTIFKNNFFENPYKIWSGNRILIKGLSSDSSKYYDEKRTLYADRYKLKVQLFVDINNVCDSVQVVTKTIFDPYESFFYFETTKESQAFLNIYFDLMEIERRKLEIELEKVKNDPQSIRMIYTNVIDQAKKMSNTYFKEVQRGTNQKALQKWNNLVLQELYINNMELFGIEIK